MTIPTPKEAARQLVDRIGDDASFEDIQHELYVLQKIYSGLEDVAVGRTFSREDAERRLRRWLGEEGLAERDG